MTVQDLIDELKRFDPSDRLEAENEHGKKYEVGRVEPERDPAVKARVKIKIFDK